MTRHLFSILKNLATCNLNLIIRKRLLMCESYNLFQNRITFVKLSFSLSRPGKGLIRDFKRNQDV